MYHTPFQRYCTSTAWRFSSLRSVQLAAFERTASGGNPEHMAQLCRTTR